MKIRGSIAAAVLVVVVAGSGGCDSTPTQDGAAYADRLRAAVSTDAVMAHLRQLQDIANRNGGTRQTGTPGYSASVDYVVKALEDKGFDVQTPEFELGIFHVDAESLTVDGAPVAARAVEYSGATSAAGVTGPLVAVPAADTPGCEPTTTTPCRSRTRWSWWIAVAATSPIRRPLRPDAARPD